MPAAEIAEMGQVIYHSGRRLERLVENFLVYAQIEILAGDPQKVAALRKSRTRDVAGVIGECARGQAAAAGRPADLSLDLEPEVVVPMSEESLRRIVIELVQNAFKFSSAGTTVQVRLCSDDRQVLLEVLDQGRGFSTEHITRIGAYMQFERRVHEQQGLGLGLTIAKKLAELHGGIMTIQSERGATTEIKLALPKPA